MITRREILAYTTGMAASLPMQKLTDWLPADPKTAPLMIFEKVLQNLSPRDLAEAIVEIGADGIEVAIRPGGRIEPAAVHDTLPTLVNVLKQQNKKIFVATTNITSATPESRRLLQALVNQQITHYRMGYYRWDPKQNLQKNRTAVEGQLKELAQLNRELGITGLYQNHAGKKYIGATIIDMVLLLEKISGNEINLALDLRHLRAESGLSWPTLARLAKPHVGCLYIKDARWRGPKSQQLENVPLGSGFVDRDMFESVRKQCPSVPISLHVEYHGGKPLVYTELRQAIDSYRTDTQLLRQWMTST